MLECMCSCGIRCVQHCATAYALTNSSQQVLGFVGTAFGSFAAGVIISSLEQGGRPLVDCYRAVFLVYSFVAVLKVVLSLWMSIYTELEHPPILVKAISTPTQVDPERQPLLDSANTPSLDEQVSIVDDTAVEAPSHPPASQPLPLLRLAYLCILFSMDSFASSLIPTSFIAYYFQLRFNASVRIITSTFATAAFIGGLSQLLAGSIAKRAGIIKTMVGTHSLFCFLLLSSLATHLSSQCQLRSSPQP